MFMFTWFYITMTMMTITMTIMTIINYIKMTIGLTHPKMKLSKIKLSKMNTVLKSKMS